ANPDFYSDIYARFVDTFARVAAGDRYPHLFFIDGGALAVENALKCAMDWKVRRNIRAGKGERGQEILHFKEAFHGRSGYTLSLTNTHDPNKHRFFAKFPWPRVTNPKIDFSGGPLALARTIEREEQAREEIERIVHDKATDIAAIIIEPIQGEGGDHHFRPEFFAFLREVCDQHDILLIFDEVQTGFGLTGTFWAAEQTGVWPDLIAFGKKAQICGFMAGRRIDEEPENVFNVPSRISSTFGGNLPDMLRSTVILETIEKENLVENARKRGAELLAGLQALAAETAEMDEAAGAGLPDHHASITCVRGKGLMVAFDLPSPSHRREFLAALKKGGLVALGCGEKTVRFRPHLNVTAAQIQEILRVVRAVALGRGNVKPGEPLHENTNNGRKRRKTGGYGNVA
ncbi:MAG TPA: aminotransferase class III-fold pyridoxal phosphate-dependent enzyme, partial [Planctomycetota bacterium]|nr:aminotransferase class III-fold pyridoxal phosphate-dependent enzyme [Planctomycetota bacterium]